MTQTAQTREALVEVMARAICLRELIIRNASTQRERDYDDDELRAIAEHEWVEWVTGATDALAALEAAGVRLVPADATFQMYDATKDHCEQTNSAGDPPNPFRIWSLMITASPYARKGADQ